MEVFASFDCPHCKDLHETTMPLIIRDYVVPGKVYLVNREFPLSGQYHPYAREAADLRDGGGPGRKVPAGGGGAFQELSLRGRRAARCGSSIAPALTPAEQKKVQMLAKDPGVVAEVQREYQEGVAAGINATPTVIVTQGAKRYPIPAQQLHYGFLKSLLDGMVK